MKAKIIICTFLLGLLLPSCIPSLYPLYKNQDLKTNDLLKGLWKEVQDENYTWEISAPKDDSRDFVIFKDTKWSDFDEAGRTYRLEGGHRREEPGKFALHLVELDGQDYLNFYPMDWELSHDFLNWHMVEANIFSRVEISTDTLFVHFFDPDYMEQLILENRIKISHVKLDERIFITARTEELQKFVKKFGNNPEAYIKTDTLVRAN